MATRSAVRAELNRITDAWSDADRRSRQAPTADDRQAALEEREAIQAELWAAKDDLAALFVLLLRYAIAHRPCEVWDALLGGALSAARDYWKPADNLAQLTVEAIGYASMHRPEELAKVLTVALRSELAPLNDAVACLEAGKVRQPSRSRGKAAR